jgi:uncharacterized protein YjbJ (UPF0337 family)
MSVFDYHFPEYANHVILRFNSVMIFRRSVFSFVPLQYRNNLNTIPMNTTEVKGNWNEQKGKLKQKFAVLTDNDLMYEQGKKDEMIGKLQIKLGKTKEEMDTIIKTL